MEVTRGHYVLSDDKSRLDIDVIHKLLNGTYWAAERSRETVEKSIEHSVCIGAFRNGLQVGFARAITDFVTYTYFCDVIIAPSERGQGLGKSLVEVFLDHPDLQTTTQTLRTMDAHTLYERFGFERCEFLYKSKNDWSKGRTS
jgi:GNAT superfamily N-acetyltransferase